MDDPNERQRLSMDEARALLPELEESGLGVAAFARARNVTTWALYRARRDRRAARSKVPAPMTEVAVVPERWREPTDASSIELKLPTGISVRVPNDFDEVALRRLLGTLATC